MNRIMDQVSRICIVGLLLAYGAPANAQEASAVGERPKAEEDKRLTVVLDAERPSKTDILLLRNGDKLTGTVLNKTFAIRTSYASLSFNNRMIAGIDLEGGANNIEAIITVNNNRFSGFIDDPMFVFKLQSGAQIEIRREKVLKAIFRVREAERQGIPQRQFVVLKSGDYFSGKILTDKVTVATTYAKIPVALNEAESITLIGAQTPLTKILMRNNDTVQGVLETEDIEIELDVGPKVGIYKDRINVMYTTDGFVPSNLNVARFGPSQLRSIDFEKCVSSRPVGSPMPGVAFPSGWKVHKLTTGELAAHSGSQSVYTHANKPTVTFNPPVTSIVCFGSSTGKRKAVHALDANDNTVASASFAGTHCKFELTAKTPVIRSMVIQNGGSDWVIDDLSFR